MKVLQGFGKICLEGDRTRLGYLWIEDRIIVSFGCDICMCWGDRSGCTRPATIESTTQLSVLSVSRTCFENFLFRRAPLTINFAMKIGRFVASPAVLAASLLHADGFGVASRHSGISRDCRSAVTVALQLVPLRGFRDECTLFSDPNSRLCFNEDGMFKTDDGQDYELCLAEDADLPQLSRFIVKSFGVDAVRISRDATSFERLLLTPALEIVNGYSGLISFAEVLVGLRQRMQHRLQTTMDLSAPRIEGLLDEEKIHVSSTTSIVLVLAKKNEGIDTDADIIASVELRLEPCDAKIPFTLPWLDRMERQLASLVGVTKNSAAGDVMPYLSSLCVDERYRGKRIGRSLVRCVEEIAGKCRDAKNESYCT